MALMTKVGMEFIARDRSGAGMLSLTRNLSTLNHRFTSLGRTLLTVAGIGGFGYMIKKQADYIDATAKLSDRIKISTQALVGLQYGAKISGVETETLNKSLEIFSRRIGEVDMGIGQARYSLEKLGLDYRDIIGLKMDEAFGIVADRINNLSTQAEKAAAANYLFGRSGQQLLNLFEKGSAGIEDFRIEAEKLGLAFTRIDAAKVEAANDALTRTRALFTGLFRQITIELAPYIEAASNAFINFATQGKGVGANVVNVFEAMTRGADAFITEIEKIPIEIKKAGVDLLRLQGTWELLSPAGMINKLRRGRGELSPWQRADVLETAVSRQQGAAIGRDIATTKFFQKIRADAERNANLLIANRGTTATDTSMLIGPPAPTDLAARQKDINNQILIDTRTYLESVRAMHDKTRMEKIRILDNYLAEHYEKLKQLPAAEELIAKERLAIERSRVNQVEVYNAELREDMENINLYISDKYAETARSIEGSMSSAFESMIKDGTSWRDAMASFLSDVSAAFARMAADMAARAVMANIAMPLAGGIAGGIGSLFASIFHGGGIAGEGGPGRMVPAMAFAGAQRMHSGGIAGLSSDEVPAILQRGEPVLPRGMSLRAPSVVIYNESGQVIEQKNEPTYDGENWVVSLIAKNYTQGGSLKKMFR